MIDHAIHARDRDRLAAKLPPLCEAYRAAAAAVEGCDDFPDDDLIATFFRAETELAVVLRYAMPDGFEHEGFRYTVTDTGDVRSTPLALIGRRGPRP